MLTFIALSNMQSKSQGHVVTLEFIVVAMRLYNSFCHGLNAQIATRSTSMIYLWKLLASEFVSFLEKTYPQNEIMMIGALSLTLIVPSQHEECKKDAARIALKIINLVDESKCMHWKKLPISKVPMIAAAYECAGSASLLKGSGISENSLEFLRITRYIYESYGLTALVGGIDRLIDHASIANGKSRLSVEYQLITSQDLYESCSEKYRE